MNRERMAEQLILHEGYRMKPYLDTEGFWTVGIGYNLSARGVDAINRLLGTKFKDIASVRLSRDEAVRVLLADIDRVERVSRVRLPEYDLLDEVRQRVVIDMSFNMGLKALGFKRAIAALKRRDWSGCVRELYQSKWAQQVGDGEGGKFDRAERLAGMMLTGIDYTR